MKAIYLSSGENKAWKKLRPVQDLNLWPLWYQCSALPTELSPLFKYIHSRLFTTSQFIWNQHNDQVGLLAQLVERCTSITEASF